MTSKSSKFCALLICIPCLAGSLAAQSMAKRQLVLPLSDGGFVAFRSETSASDNNQVMATQSLAGWTSVARGSLSGLAAGAATSEKVETGLERATIWPAA